MRQQFNEVPFIAFYRKEYIRPELQINDLWRVYHFDELWCKLQSRKRNLKQLYQNMMAYQGMCYTLTIKFQLLFVLIFKKVWLNIDNF